MSNVCFLPSLFLWAHQLPCLFFCVCVLYLLMGMSCSIDPWQKLEPKHCSLKHTSTSPLHHDSIYCSFTLSFIPPSSDGFFFSNFNLFTSFSIPFYLLLLTLPNFQSYHHSFIPPCSLFLPYLSVSFSSELCHPTN